ncbi:MAG: hypothetical protein Q8Q81_06915, partial [Oxalobacteraceae bacterium]|nr:hypothetical protein [Oxalobacteraceae bacterium]
LRVSRRGSGKSAKNGWGFGSIGMSIGETCCLQQSRTVYKDFEARLPWLQGQGCSIARRYRR